MAQAGVQVSFLSGAPLFGPPPMPVAGAQVLHTPWLRWFPWDKVKGGWRLRHAEFALLDCLGLVDLAEQQHPHSVLVDPLAKFTIYLPPKRCE